MATAVHIPIEELSADTRAFIERAETASDLVVDSAGERFRISRIPKPGRTAMESYEFLRTFPDAAVEVDEGWSKDMAAIIALRYSEPDRDPWE